MKLKGNYLYFLTKISAVFIFVFFGVLDNIKADEVPVGKDGGIIEFTDFIKVQDLKICTTTNCAIQHVSSHFNVFYLGDEQAFCLDHLETLNRNMKYYPKAKVISLLLKRIYAYGEGHVDSATYDLNSNRTLKAQIAAWVYGETGGLSEDNYASAYYQVKCQKNHFEEIAANPTNLDRCVPSSTNCRYSGSTLICDDGDWYLDTIEDSNRIDARLISSTVSTIKATTPYDGVLFEWESYDYTSGFQTLVAPYGGASVVCSCPISSLNPGKYLSNDDPESDECISLQNSASCNTVVTSSCYCPSGTTNAGDYLSDDSAGSSTCQSLQSTKCNPPEFGTVEIVSDAANCDVDGKTNIGTFEEVYNKDIAGEDNKFGSVVDEIFASNEYCKLYCLESATQAFPGSIVEPVSIGTVLTWPTGDGSSYYEDKYNLSFSGEKVCTVIVAGTEYDSFSDGNTDPVEDYEKYYAIAEELQDNPYKSYDVENISSDTTKSCESIYASDINYWSSRVSSLTQSLNAANSKVSNLESQVAELLAEKEETENNCTTTSEFIEPYIYYYVPGVGNKKIGTMSIVKNCETWYGGTALTSIYSQLNSAKSSASSISSNLSSAKDTLEDFKSLRDDCDIDVNSYEDALNAMSGIVSKLKACGNLDALYMQSDIYNFKSNATLVADLGNSSKKIVLEGSPYYTCAGDCNGVNVNFNFPDTDNYTEWSKYESLTSNKVKTDIVDQIGDGDQQFTLNAYANYSITEIPELELENKEIESLIPGFIIPRTIDVTNSYSLNIINTELGHNGLFNGELGNDYTCSYTPSEDIKPDVGDKYCPNSAINISTCLQNKSYEECVDLFCYGNYTNYKCPSSYGDNEGKSITNCVMTKISQDKSEEEAISDCEQLLCPLSDGLRIIYRTINLDYPFPGKNLESVAFGFNSDISGRYPGSNWNDVELVKDEILNNRGVLGYNVYDKTSLYEFELTPSIIKEIRKYNDQQADEGGYADYTLDCKIDNTTACVSDFIHGQSSIGSIGLVGGLCMNATNSNDFYVCSEG